MANDFRRIAELIDQRRTFVVATVASTQGSTPRKSGARMIVHADGAAEGTIGGGAMEQHVRRQALDLLANGSATRLVTVNLRKDQPHSVGGICGGDVELFLEKFVPGFRLIIFGAGHCGRSLARIGAELDFSLVICDDRPEFAEPRHFPPGCKVICGPFEQAAELTDPQPDDAVVAMTYAWPKDQLVLAGLVHRPLRFLGMIGSAYKCKKVLDGLREQGLGDELIARIGAPIGVEIGAHTPAEVAVSIAAQLVKLQNLSQV